MTIEIKLEQSVSQVKPEFASLTRPTRDAVRSAQSLGVRQARYLADSYYQVQELRKATSNQAGSMIRAEVHGHESEPHETLDWLIKQTTLIESQLARMFEYYATASAPGRWLLSVHGIGPVLAANFLARFSVHPWKCVNAAVRQKRAIGEDMVLPCPPERPCLPQCGYRTIETAGGFWKFAGLDPSTKWEAGELRPWNAAAKVACWKASDSWVKLKNNPQSFYSKIYVARKERESARNEAGDFAEQAALGAARVGKSTQAYKHYAAGRLPPGHLEARARRYTVKLFLSHLHEVMYEDEFSRKPPNPFAIAKLGHAHYIPVPGWPLKE